jgi:hypothetical protein
LRIGGKDISFIYEKRKSDFLVMEIEEEQNLKLKLILYMINV